MEIWMPVKGWGGLYEVSNCGRFKSLSHVVYGGHNRKQIINVKVSIRTHSGKIGDYLTITFCKRPIQRRFFAHRIIAEHFIPNPQNKPQVNHLNGNKEDNRVCNLEWVTEKENSQHAVAAGLRNKKIKRRKKLESNIVLEIFNSQLSLQKLSNVYKLPKLTVQAIKSGKRYGRITQKPYFGKNGRSKIYGIEHFKREA